jgi:hypothetical protein
MQALLAVGVGPRLLSGATWTPLMYASRFDKLDVTAFLLGLPPVQATINHISTSKYSALSLASAYAHSSVVQLLLDAGTNPTIPAGNRSPINEAISNGHAAVAALLRRSIADSQCSRSLLKARALLDTAHKHRMILAGNDDDDKEQDGAAPRRSKRLAPKHKALLAAPPYLKSRVAAGRELPSVQVLEGENEELVACLKYALGLEDGGGVHEGGGPPPQGMLREVFVELCEMLVPKWDRANV